jgi:hypothetical protein
MLAMWSLMLLIYYSMLLNHKLFELVQIENITSFFFFAVICSIKLVAHG